MLFVVYIRLLLLLLLMLLCLTPVGPSTGHSGKGECLFDINRLNFRGVIGKIGKVYLFPNFYQSLLQILKIVVQPFGVDMFNAFAIGTVVGLLIGLIL